MSDLISRQAAIDVLNKLARENFTLINAFSFYLGALHDAADEIKNLPSAQPERPSEIQDILDYLDTVLHPIISPEHWNVYSELHDMISTLSSAQPEQRWIPCSERLPEENSDILVTYVEKDEKRIVPVNYGCGTWFDCLFDKVLNQVGVLAWMPLPEPWRGEQE